MKNARWAFLLFIVCLFLAQQSANAQASLLQGRVTGQDSVGKPNAFVRFDGAARYSVTTDRSGAFSIRDFKEGSYTIEVRQGNRRQTFIYTVTPSRPLALKVSW